MPEGLVRTDLNSTGTSYRRGFPITLPHQYATTISEPKNFGTPIPVADATKHSNPVTWVVSPSHFGNIIS